MLEELSRLLTLCASSHFVFWFFSDYIATVRESFLKGPNGGVKLESVWDGDRLLTIIVKGGQ